MIAPQIYKDMAIKTDNKISKVQSTVQTVGRQGSVSMRNFAYPYKSMFAICSDLDSTPDRNVYLESMRFMNTKEKTGMGEGVGLEVGHSIYFDTHSDTFSYWNTDDAGRCMIRSMIQSGHIDCLHSFGEKAYTRYQAGRALEELSRHDCYIKVWVDHGSALSNFGEDIMMGVGDIRSSPIYHADLSYDYGIRYVWRGRVTSIIGQNANRHYGGLWNYQHPFLSAKTIVKEMAKGVMPYMGGAKYLLNQQNKVLSNCQLRSGHRVVEFLRSNPHWAGPGAGATADGFADVVNKSFLQRLVDRKGVCVLYTHLGKIRNYDEPFSPRTRDAMRLIAQFSNDKKILVTSTRRLLGYCRAVRDLDFTHSYDLSNLNIAVSYDGDTEDLSGLTFYVPEPEKVRLSINGSAVLTLQRNRPDHTNKPSISIPWRPLEFPSL